MKNETDPLVELFLDALWTEQGLSRNTLDAYGRDLDQFAQWLGRQQRQLAQAGRMEIQTYLAECAGNGVMPRTTARQLSSLRRFYRYLLREEVIAHDPTAEIE